MDKKNFLTQFLFGLLGLTITSGCANSDAPYESAELYLLTSEYVTSSGVYNDHERVIGVYNSQTEEYNTACYGNMILDPNATQFDVKNRSLKSPERQINFTIEELSQDGSLFKLTANNNAEMVVRGERISNLIDEKNGYLKYGGTDGQAILCHNGTLELLNDKHESGALVGYDVADRFVLSDTEKGRYKSSAYKFSGPYDNGLMQLSWIDLDKGVISTRVFGSEFNADNGEGRDTGWFGKQRGLLTLPETSIDWSPEGRFGFLKTGGEVQEYYWLLINYGNRVTTNYRTVPDTFINNCEIQWYGDELIDWSDHELEGQITVTFDIERNPWFFEEDCGDMEPYKKRIPIPLVKPSVLESQILQRKNRQVCSKKSEKIEEVFATALFGGAERYGSDEELFAFVRKKMLDEIPELARLGCRKQIDEVRSIIRDLN